MSIMNHCKGSVGLLLPYDTAMYDNMANYDRA